MRNSRAGPASRGTVGSTAKAAYLNDLFEEYGDKLEVVVVEDITKDGAFDEAVKGVDAVEHTASPFHTKADDPEELIRPAVDGTTGILKSILKYGDRVKRVVVTSSCAAVLEILPEPKTFNEENWNTLSVKEVEEKGKAANNMSKYRASKTLAERGTLLLFHNALTLNLPQTAAWEIYESNKSNIKWDLVVINPPFVFGVRRKTLPSAHSQ